MNKGAQIDYKHYAQQMRNALSGQQICRPDMSLNHAYFNTKKGFYWSDNHQKSLIQGLLTYGMDWSKIRREMFMSNKSQVELEMRTCLLFQVNDLGAISSQQIQTLAREDTKSSDHHKEKKKIKINHI